MHIPISRHFKYWYQKEGRFVWLPPPSSFKRLEPLDIEIGPIDDIAKLMVL
jgi:hypothetical protein